MFRVEVLKMEMIYASETYLTTYKTVVCHNPEYYRIMSFILFT
jgi:hypothetical protein